MLKCGLSTISADNFNKPGRWTDGDFDGNGHIQFADFLLLADNFGNTLEVAAASVPEPSMSLLGFVGLMVMLSFRRARNAICS